MSAVDKLAELDAAASPGHYPDSDPPHGNCDGCKATRNRAALSKLLYPVYRALDGIVTGLEADDHYCCHHARLGRDDHTEDCYVGVARKALKALEEALP